MAAMVRRDVRTRYSVFAKIRASVPGGTRRIRPEAMPETSSAVPVAESQLKVKTAFSFSTLATTGGTRSTVSCSTGTIGATESLFIRVFTLGNPHTKTMIDRMIHGDQAR